MASASAPSAQLRYRCLLLDHDDTTVRSTEEIHYPAHVESLRELRPDLEPVTLHGWFERNHAPGVSKYLKSLFSEEQMEREHAIWVRAMERMQPHFYEGMPELLAEFRARGGRVAVISHSPAEVIWRHYEAHPEIERIRPDLVLGWDNDPERRKPSTWPALHALEQLGMAPHETLVLDDLSPGVKMGKGAGVAVAASGWGHRVPVIEEYMRQECDHFFGSVQELSEFLLGAEAAHVAAL